MGSRLVSAVLAVALIFGAGAPRALGQAPVPDEAFLRGDYVASAVHWSSILSASRQSGDVTAARDALERRAAAHFALGFLDRAEADLLEALETGKPMGPDVELRLKGMLGAVRTSSNAVSDARADLGESFLMAVRSGDRRAEAATLNNIGNFLLLESRLDEAVDAYEESAAIADRTGAADVAWRGWLNAAELHEERGETGAAAKAADAAGQRLTTAPRSAQTINGLVKLGALRTRLAVTDDAMAASHGAAAHAVLSEARSAAAAIGDARLESYSTAHLGELYETGGRWAEANRLTRSAIALAERADAPEALYRWQWQLGRILRAQGDSAGAIAAHEHAIATLGTLRTDIVSGFGTGRAVFEDTVRPLILGLADLQLRESSRAANAGQRQRLLAEARETVELLKAAEFEDYFNDDCLAALATKRRALDALPPRTAALYPVVLPDRVELILSMAGSLHRAAVPASAGDVERTVRSFRSALVSGSGTEYLGPAMRLHEWLIRPVEAMLDQAGIDTLVVVPSGTLASIPFAALADERGPIIQRRSVAVAPGLLLTDPRPFGATQPNALVGGLSEPVAGFPPLPFVENELSTVSSLFPSETLRNQSFRRSDLASALDRTPYRIVHLATHARFEPEVRNSFLLTYDGRLDMNGLERLVRLSRFRDEPIELLTLSACSTAEGDPRAALGLAGLALKSGARSALASLWLVNDRSTAELVSHFYSELRQPGVSKAEALRRAQLAVMADSASAHPSHWASFLIIGNWL